MLNIAIDIDAVGGKHGRTPLLMAVEHNSQKAVHELICRGADVFAKDDRNQHIVHIVAHQGNPDTAKVKESHII